MRQVRRQARLGPVAVLGAALPIPAFVALARRVAAHREAIHISIDYARSLPRLHAPAREQGPVRRLPDREDPHRQ
jgi:hypothetical protein